MNKIDETIESLKAGLGNLRCDEVRELLEQLGFKVRNGSNGKHRVITHPGLSKASGFLSASYDCGHGRNPEIKRPYIRKLISILEVNRDVLVELLGGVNG